MSFCRGSVRVTARNLLLYPKFLGLSHIVSETILNGMHVLAD